MKQSNLLFALLICLFFWTVHAAETLSEKGEAVSKDVKRDVNQSVNRIGESICTSTDVECGKRKIENRVEEGKDLIKDKSSEMKDKVD